MSKYRMYQSPQIREGKKLLRLYSSGHKNEHMKFICQTGDPFWSIVLASCTCNEADKAKQTLAASSLTWYWKKHNSPTFFPENAALLEMLCFSKLSVVSSSINIKWPIFAFSPPSGCVVDGIELSPFLFHVGKTSEHKRAVSDMVNECPVSFSFQHVLKSVFFAAPNDDLFCYLSIGDHAISFNSLFDEFVETINNESKLEHALIHGEVHHNKKMIKLHAKLAVMLLVYAQAFPECVVPGIPSDMSIKEMMHGGPKNKRTGFTIKAPIDAATSRALHLRRGHFRSLHDERYKRADDGSIKIVWVRESVVGGKIDPYTVEAHAAAG